MKKRIRSIIAVALALVICIAALTGCVAKNPANTAVTPDLIDGGVLLLKVNPEIEIDYDAEGLVTAVIPRNRDAEEILATYTGYEGKECRVVVSELVELIGEAGYFIEEIEGYSRQITIEIESGSSLPSATFLDDMAEDVRVLVNSNNWHSPVDIYGESDYGITDYIDTDYGPDNDGVTDYNDTDYGPNNDGVTDFIDTDYGPNNDGVTDYNDTDYGPNNDGITDFIPTNSNNTTNTGSTGNKNNSTSSGSSNNNSTSTGSTSNNNTGSTGGYGNTDYYDTDYGPNNDGVTDYNDTDYGPNNDGVTDYNDTDYGPNNDGVTDYSGNSNYGNSYNDSGYSNYD